LPEKPPRKAVFLDRDSTVIEDMRYSADIARMKVLPGVIEGLVRLQEAGYTLVIVTNQSGVARGCFTEAELRAFHEALTARLAESGVRLARIYYCPHYPEGKLPEYSTVCDCRKPAPGMILRAAKELALDLPDSWMIGDSDRDTAAGRGAGCRTILVETADDPQTGNPNPDFRAKDLQAAADIILGEQR